MQDIYYIENDLNSSLKFLIHSKGRYLELEAQSNIVKDKWLRALRYFIFKQIQKIV